LLTQTLFAFPFARALLGPLPWNLPRHLKVWLLAWWPFLLAGLVPALLAPLGTLVLRDLALQSGWSAAGQWQAAIRLTDLVAQLWNGAVASWLLSHVAKQQGRESIRKPLWIATAGMAILCVCLAITAPLALWVAYGNGFADAVPLLRWQILSEVPRTLGWLLTTALIARKQLKQVMVLDLLGTLLMVGLAYALHAHLELRALPIASFLENLVFAGCALWLWNRTPATHT
jgi:O-antigen/teichoic acid export membrane protein